jgi:hypothetical protein
MPKTKNYTVSLPKIYRRKYEDIGMLFWIESRRQVIPATSVEQCIESFFDFIGVNGNLESALSNYTRLKKEFHEDSKTNI